MTSKGRQGEGDHDPAVAKGRDDFAFSLAKRHEHVVHLAERSSSLLSRLDLWNSIIKDSYTIFSTTKEEDLIFSRSSEWMLDNFHLTEEAIHEIHEDLPLAYLNQLPKLSSTDMQGLPRIFAVAREIIKRTLGQFDVTFLINQIRAYQEHTTLSIGELWAFPDMLRISVLELLAQATMKITRNEKKHSAEFQWEMLVTTDLAKNDGTVANCFLCLRMLSGTDWKKFFEDTSVVEKVLREDPASVYPKMDFETRNNYRRVVEELSRHSSKPEVLIARMAVELALKSSPANGSNNKLERESHVGYYLVDDGLAVLEKKSGYHPGFVSRVKKRLLANPFPWYLGAILAISLFITGIIITYSLLSSGSWWQVIVAGFLGFGLALEAGINLVQWFITRQFPPHRLPRLDFSNGIPENCRTMVVIPTLLDETSDIHSLVQELELHYLRNTDRYLTFAILSDFSDSPSPNAHGDDALLSLVSEEIEKLNRKYQPFSPFYFFHRKRTWNPKEGKWMGWERKRGKLLEFNRLVSGSQQTSYIKQTGDLKILNDIRYVITLDTDTSLPQSSAARLIATLAHILNRAVFESRNNTVIAGYTILQPRVEIKPTNAMRTIFSRIFAGSIGYDLYSLTVSDVYQDFFHEGSYVGKGIYEISSFERSVSGKIPDNTLLSHDLLESLLGRTALVTDIVLYEEYPRRYLDYANRNHRWIRGDWQLLPWLFRGHSQKLQNQVPFFFSWLDRWKIIDNLRRSLLTTTLLAFLASAWLLLPGSPLLWTVLVLLAPASTFAIQTFQRFRSSKSQLAFKDFLKSLQIPIMRWILQILFLPYEALLSLDAIGITLYRLAFTHRHMLQWTSSATIFRRMRHSFSRVWIEMAVASILSAFLALIISLFHSSILPFTLPILIGWFISPQVAYTISLPIRSRERRISDSQRIQIQMTAHRTWSFFRQFVGPDNHWLPPDHFQKEPYGIVAHYTTPTNIGFYLLSVIAAYDLGYIGLLEMQLRLRNTFETLEHLERYRGHFLNWYDTRTLAPLLPRYVSTVDSGNLAASLISLRQGCLAMPNSPIVGEQEWDGVTSNLENFSHILTRLGKVNLGLDLRSFQKELEDIKDRTKESRGNPLKWPETLHWLLEISWQQITRNLTQLLENIHGDVPGEILTEIQIDLDLLHLHWASMQRSLNTLAPWFEKRTRHPDFISYRNPALWTLWQSLMESLPSQIPTLSNAESKYNKVRKAFKEFEAKLGQLSLPSKQIEETRAFCREFASELDSASAQAKTLIDEFSDIASKSDGFYRDMDFKFLFDDKSHVFHIGYNITREEMDRNFYDLLASEARVASIVAIAKRDVPYSHWEHLGRPVTRVNGKQTLLSWGGTAFEYLMPSLIMKNYEGTLLADSCQNVISELIQYATNKHVPWGISESGFFAFDAGMNYQYRAFGVPELGFKRNQQENLVIAPYASAIALSMKPHEVLANFLEFEKLGMVGEYGFYEAMDFTQDRLPPRQKFAIVKSYMAHHQGMILVAMANFLTSDRIVKRFHADERIQSVEILLQEKIPQNPPIEYPHPAEAEISPTIPRMPPAKPWNASLDLTIPQVHLLSGAKHGTLITESGGGFSQWNDLALTRWEADTTLDNWGSWIYLRDLDNDNFWSVTSQPAGKKLDNREVIFHPHKAEFFGSTQGISTRTGVTVSEDDVEIREVNITNNSDRVRRLQITSYGEVVLAAQSTDRRHPLFNKLFIHSESLTEQNALLFSRRRQSPEEKQVYLGHALVLEPGRKRIGDHELNRLRFLGRSRNPSSPVRLTAENLDQIPGSNGSFDPIFSLSQDILLRPRAKSRIIFLTLASDSRNHVLEKMKKYQSPAQIEQAFENSRVGCEGEMAILGVTSEDIQTSEKILSAMVYPHEALRASQESLSRNSKGQSGLWAYGISGDFPILLIHMRDSEGSLLIEAIRAFSYWKRKFIRTNLVILNDQDIGYRSELHNEILQLLSRLGADVWLNHKDGIYLLRADQINDEDKVLLETAARVVMDTAKGTFTDQANLSFKPINRLPVFIPSLPTPQESEPTSSLKRPMDLNMDNGFGGFDTSGKEYIIYLPPNLSTPRPWVNVIANPRFGFLVSESGSGTTWVGNSGENRLTSWRNDPVSDIPSEALYLRDEENAIVWSPTPLPSGTGEATLIKHGAGYSEFETQSHGLYQRMRIFADRDLPVKIIQLKLRNLWKRSRRITATYYVEWVLGPHRDVTQAFIIPEFNPSLNALLARNRYNPEFPDSVAFLAANKKIHGLTTDRTEFLGRLGSMKIPAALTRIGLAGTVKAGGDPCAALQLHVDLVTGGEEEIFFFLGEGESEEEVKEILEHFQATGNTDQSWISVQQFWDEILGQIEVHTPDPSMDILLNRWLLYQVLSCRLWGRTALYQSSGAFGFRDQVQDVLALLHTRPDIARTHILNAAKSQFEEGDVLHWWHPPFRRGVRTRISDDLLWLPFATGEYVASTGDVSILDEKIPFLKSPPLDTHEKERYGNYEQSADTYPLLEHCHRALKKGMTAGPHGLPLFGAGDWNDGYNRVGKDGKGESIWLGWFLSSVLDHFIDLCKLTGDDPAPYLEFSAELMRNIDKHAWDGEWYLRGFYDDGTPLGSNKSEECRIDSLAQSWAIISRKNISERALEALRTVDLLLIDGTHRLIKLFEPPFNRIRKDPGYIKAYPPGIRENGVNILMPQYGWQKPMPWLGKAIKRLNCLTCLIQYPNRIPRRRLSSTGWNHIALRLISTVNRLTPGSEDGHGIPVPRHGCTGWEWKIFSAFISVGMI